MAATMQLFKSKANSNWMTYLHNPRSRLLSLAVLALFTLTGLSWLTAGRTGELSSGFLFLLVSFTPFFGVLLALAGSSSDISPLPVCFPFFFASAPFLALPALDATCLLGVFLLLGDEPHACAEQKYTLRTCALSWFIIPTLNHWFNLSCLDSFT